MRTCEYSKGLLLEYPDQHFASVLLLRFASDGELQKVPITGRSKFSTRTIMILNHTNPRYMRENFRARRYAQMENLSIATAIRFMTCRTQRM
jgi:hypothetical protein